MKKINKLSNLFSSLRNCFEGKEKYKDIFDLVNQDIKVDINKDHQLVDKFGNRFTFENRGDTVYKLTFANERSKFMFLGDVYSVDILNNSTLIKDYMKLEDIADDIYKSSYGNDDDDEIALVQDIYGRLILRRWYRIFDRAYVDWVFVCDETDANELTYGHACQCERPEIRLLAGRLANEESIIARQPHKKLKSSDSEFLNTKKKCE